MLENQSVTPNQKSIETTPETPIATEIVKEPVVRPEMNPALSHKDRIIAFLNGKRGKIEFNSFLKSLYPIVKPPTQPEYTLQPVMKRLKILLKELQSEGYFTIGQNVDQLGRAHFPDQASGRTHYYDLTNLSLEIQVP